MTPRTVKVERVFNRFSDWIGTFSAILLMLLVANVFFDVVMRYLFNDVSIGMQELRVASVFDDLPVRCRLHAQGGWARPGGCHLRAPEALEKWAVIDILGTLLFLWPFCFLVAGYGLGFAYEAYDINEVSGDPGGLPFCWKIKGMISLSADLHAR